MTGYRAEADALDAEISAAMHAWHVSDFDDLALRIFEHQLRYNKPYARFCAGRGITPASMPDAWFNIPPVPAGAFKEAALCTFDPAHAFLTFETSGTTAQTTGKHYLESSALYDASLHAGFQKLFLRGGKSIYRFLLLMSPFSFNDARQSSLAYMMDRASEAFGDHLGGSYLKDGRLLFDEFAGAVRRAIAQNVPVVLAGTALSFHTWIEAARRSAAPAQPLPAGSLVMETGGFKGRLAHVDRNGLYADIARAFSIPQSSIIAEYGMTELLSQYYDRSGDEEPRVKIAPPWLRSYAVDENGVKVPPGVVGALAHVDLANRSSCVAIQTEDLGAVYGDGGLVLLGRDEHAELRGCSLDAELLHAE